MCPRTLPGPKERPEARKDQNAGTEWHQSGLGTHQWAAYPPTRSLELRLRGRRWGHLASEQPTTDLERRLLDLMGAQEPNGATRGIEKGLRMPAGKVFFGTPFASPALIRLSASPGGGDSAGPIRARQIGREIDATLPGLSVCTQARRGLLGTDYVCSPSLIPGGSGIMDLGSGASGEMARQRAPASDDACERPALWVAGLRSGSGRPHGFRRRIHRTIPGRASLRVAKLSAADTAF